ncbi:MAG: nucleoside kinase [Bacteroidales bacterium]|nr:nucleoside kinase [Bacteroidales bacterium]
MKIKIDCPQAGGVCEIEAGMTLAEIAESLKIELRYSVLGAAVNNHCVGLTYRIYQPSLVKFYDICEPEGRRTYNRSLILMMLAAIEEEYPGVRLHVLHAVSRGVYCILVKDKQIFVPTEADIKKIDSKMRALCKAELPIERQTMPTEQAIKKIGNYLFTSRLLEQHGDLYTTVHSIGEHSAVLYEDLVPNTRILDSFELHTYFKGLLLMPPAENDPDVIPEMTRQDKMFATFVEADKWQYLLKASSLSDLNKAISDGNGYQVIQVVEALHEKKIAEIADLIASKRDKIKVILIAGPSSSGKTTFSKRLAIQLVVNGMRPQNLSIDNYFVDREHTPRDADGKYDFDTIDAIDVKFFNEQLLDLINGKEVELPKFDFKQGKRVFDGEKMKLPEGAVLIIEGTHGLTPQLTPMIPTENKFKIYTAPLASINIDELTRIPTTDNRLIRRIVRDYYNRGHNAEATIAQWPSVRRGEIKYIYANQEEADVMFNSALLYELSALKTLAEPILLEVKQNSPQHPEAVRLLRLLSYFNPLPFDAIPPTSLLREFVGGSSFKYD